MSYHADTVHGESIRITGHIPEDKPCFVISCNRGEIAADTLRAAKEIMNPHVLTATLHTAGDAQYPYVAQSEYHLCIGPDNFSPEQVAAGRAKTPYMDIPTLLTACGIVRKIGEDLFGKDGFKFGIHPGYGMLSEEQCMQSNIPKLVPNNRWGQDFTIKDILTSMDIKEAVFVNDSNGY